MPKLADQTAIQIIRSVGCAVLAEIRGTESGGFYTVEADKLEAVQTLFHAVRYLENN